MLVIDGDSVAVLRTQHYPQEKHWHHLLAVKLGVQWVCMATNKATAQQCADRLWRAFQESTPKLYVLVIGQWSQNHEPIHAFEHAIRYIIEECHQRGTDVCLVGGTQEVWGLHRYQNVMRTLARAYRTGFLNPIAYIKDEHLIEDGSVHCHLNEAGSAVFADKLYDALA